MYLRRGRVCKPLEHTICYTSVIMEVSALPMEGSLVCFGGMQGIENA
jgi:hypothetical protein